MHTFVSLNSSVTERDQAKLGALSQASLYGKAVFTTIAVYGGRPFLWEKHWRRLVDNAARVDIDVSDLTSDSTASALAELITANEVGDGRARITFFDVTLSDMWTGTPGANSTLVLIVTAGKRVPTTQLRLSVSGYKVNSASPLAGVKSCSYLEKIVAKKEANERGFDECIQINERGEIASAAMANIFWTRDGGLFTPSLKTGCLAGTTREFILENIECSEVEARLEEIGNADAIFLTSAGLGVARVAELDGRALAQATHPIADLISVYQR